MACRCSGHLSRVEGERATGCRRTWPPPPLSPKTATESYVLVRISESKGFLSLLCKLMLRRCGVVHHRVVYRCLRVVLGVHGCFVSLVQVAVVTAKVSEAVIQAAGNFGLREKAPVMRLGYGIVF
ncbi:uncharacterized protein DS421_14g460430 [Arachis hypogaea]|nr:uncharacterized protein DS421_14g460430 [Arachis hypogaea]